MIRFVDIGEQTGNSEEGIKEFCFFDTITDSFLTVNNTQTWTSAEEFEQDYHAAKNKRAPLARFLALIPENFNK